MSAASCSPARKSSRYARQKPIFPTASRPFATAKLCAQYAHFPVRAGQSQQPDGSNAGPQAFAEKKVEINKLLGASKQEGYTLVPLKVYIRNGFAKLLLGLGKGKKQYDKRETAAKRDAQRDIQRALRDRQKVAR